MQIHHVGTSKIKANGRMYKFSRIHRFKMYAFRKGWGARQRKETNETFIFFDNTLHLQQQRHTHNLSIILRAKISGMNREKKSIYRHLVSLKEIKGRCCYDLEKEQYYFHTHLTLFLVVIVAWLNGDISRITT